MPPAIPDLLTWVHVAEVSNFLAAHLRYRNPHLSLLNQDRYYRGNCLGRRTPGGQECAALAAGNFRIP